MKQFVANILFKISDYFDWFADGFDENSLICDWAEDYSDWFGELGAEYDTVCQRIKFSSK